MDISISALTLYRLLKAAFPFFFLNRAKFRTPIITSEYEKFDKSWVSDASRRKWAWALKVFEEWKKQRNEAFLKQDYSSEPVIQEDERELKVNGTVDDVVNYQCAIHKLNFLKQAAIFLIIVACTLQYF